MHGISVRIAWRSPAEKDPRFEVTVFLAILRDPALTRDLVCHRFRELVTGQVKVAIPFLGGKIEPEIAKGIVTAMRVEQKTGREWLAKG